MSGQKLPQITLGTITRPALEKNRRLFKGLMDPEIAYPTNSLENIDLLNPHSNLDFLEYKWHTGVF